MSKYQIDKVDVIGYLILAPNNIKVHYEEAKKNLESEKRCPDNYFLKDWGKKMEKLLPKKERHLFVKQEGF